MAGKGDIVEQALKLVMGGGGDDAAKKAFASTRLKTPQGDPMRLYHMTPEDLFEFRASPENRSGPAVFLSPYPDFQPAYHQSAERGPSGELTNKFKEGANVMPVYADVRNPLVLDHPRKIKEAAAKYQGGDRNFPRIITPEARAALEAEGYDGIVFGGDNPIPYGDRPMDARLGYQEGRGEEFLVFDPKRVKSAVSNTGEYDFTNPDITKADGGQVREGYQTKGRVVKKLAEGIVDAVTGRSPNRVFPELAGRYPEVKDPVTAFDKKTGKEYLAKDLSPEALAVEQARKVIQKDIDAGQYQPFFDVKARADVDPFNYPSTGKTIDVKPVKPETQAKYRAMAFNPEGLARLREGYTAGLEQKDVAENWYFVKQLEDKFVEEYGPEEGRRLFKERFAKPMALTTGGADPTSNLLMSYYGNFLREKGLPIPEAAYEMPYPIGGRFASSNMGMFGRNMEKELTPDNPKRLNFQNNFLGYKEPTIDEQMSKGFDPKLQMPEWYGPYEEAINMLAREYEVDPRYFQEVAWAGLKSKGKGGYQGMPMIQHINEAIERTSRLTGVPPEDVVRRGLVRGEMPIYGVAAPAGALAVGAMGEDADEDIDNAVRIAKANGGAFTKIVKSLFGPAEREGLEALTQAGSGYKGIPGKPDVVKIPLVGEVEAKPLRPIEQAVETYMQRLGRPGAHKIDVFDPLDEEFAAKVAEEYGKMKHSPTDPEVKRAYDALAQETLDQLEAAKGAGIDFTFVKGEDPYKLSPSLGYADLAERGHMYVFPTEQGFGSDVAFDPVNNPLLKRIGPLGDLENATVNDAFRIVHDLYGHYGPGNPFFRAPGEERAFKLHSKMYSPEALPAMASETRGQNSWLNFGPYGRYNRGANAAETIYADQKTGIMPPWTYEKADGGAIDDAIRIAKDVGGSASVPVMMEDAKGNKYDAQGNIIPPTNPGPNPARSDVTPQSLAAKAVNDPATYDALMERYAIPDRDIAEYEALKQAVSKQPQAIQQMTHVGDRPRREMTIDMPLFGGEYSMGTAPYDVAEGLQGMAQTAYDFKTAPAYFFPPTAPLAFGADILESRLADDPLGFALNAALTPQGASVAKSALGAVRRNPKATAAVIGAGAYLSPDEAEAGPARWFSKAMEVARAIPMEKMTGQQALAMLRKGVSPEELKWTGADVFLPQQKQITKQDLVDYLAKNRVQTQDVVFGGAKPVRRGDVVPSETAIAPYRERWDELVAQNRAINEVMLLPPSERDADIDDLLAQRNDIQYEMDQIHDKAVDATIEEMGGLGQPTKYESYATPGGQDYRETLITLPNIPGNEVKEYQVFGAFPRRFTSEEEAQKYVEGLNSMVDDPRFEAIAANLRQFPPSIKPIYENTGFQSSHWRGTPNVLAHIRGQILETTPPGANRSYKAFNVDETQSDFAQIGRKSGFADPKERAKLPTLVKQYDELAKQHRDLERLIGNGDDTTPEIAAATKQAIEVGRQMMDLSEEMTRIRTGGIPMAPYVTSTQGWTDLSIKKSIDQALDAGADYFTFTPGEAQAARYDLSKHISKVQYNPDDGSLLAYDPKGKMVVNETVNDPEDLDEYLGKELADKMRLEAESRSSLIDEYEIAKDEETGEWGVYLYGEPASETFPSKGHARDYLNELVANDLANSPAELSGLDLKVGGEGMIDYYNNIYKKRVEKVVKDATGKKVQWEVIPVQTADGPREQLGFRLTDDMKEARFSDFNKGGRVTNKANYADSPDVSRALALTRD